MAASVGNEFKKAVEDAKLTDATSKFALSLYKSQATSSAGNIFMSPISISLAMAMTYLGAHGETKNQMKKVLFFSEVKEAKLHEAFCDLRLALKSGHDKYMLLLANRLFGQGSYKFLDSYIEGSKKFYGTELALVDFVTAPAAAIAEINRWVADNTNQKIPSILTADDITPLTRLVIVNAIYFKGDWSKKFDARHTKEEDFYASQTESVKVQMMSMRGTKVVYGVDHSLNCQAIELPYVDGSLSMFVLLPDHTVTNLSQLENGLTNDHLIDVTKAFKMQNSEVNIWLPRFKLDEKLSLKDKFAEMGIIDLFSDSKADLSGMDGSKELCVFKILHRAFVEVNEEGSEAAAATAVVVKARCLKPSFDFRADHPFLFFIRDNKTKTVLFLGRVVKP